jgi:hypothetical protein
MAAEGQFQQVMIAYGQILAQPEQTAIVLLAQQFAALAPQFGLTEAPPVDVIALAIYAAMGVCGDFEAELAGTLDAVKDNLSANGIRY